MLKTNFSEHKKIWEGTKKLGGTTPECPPPCCYGPDIYSKNSKLHIIASHLLQLIS